MYQKCQIQEYHNKNRLSVCRILLLQRKPKPGCTKPSPGSRVGHRWPSRSAVFPNFPRLTREKMWGIHGRTCGFAVWLSEILKMHAKFQLAARVYIVA